MAAVAEKKPVKLARGARALIPTGLVFEIPRGYEAQVRPRSGLALKHGVTVLNTPGTIDSDYRGEVQVILINLGQRAVRRETRRAHRAARHRARHQGRACRCNRGQRDQTRRRRVWVDGEKKS